MRKILMTLLLGAASASSAVDLVNVPKGQQASQFVLDLLRKYFGPHNVTVTPLGVNEMFIVRKDDIGSKTFIVVQVPGVFGNKRQLDLDRTRACALQIKTEARPEFYRLSGSTPIFTIMPYAGQSGPQSITKHYVKVQFSATRGTLRNVVGCGADVTEREW